MAAAVVLHWGVKKGKSGDWLLPDKDLWPSSSEVRLSMTTSLCLLQLSPGHGKFDLHGNVLTSAAMEATDSLCLVWDDCVGLSLFLKL